MSESADRYFCRPVRARHRPPDFDPRGRWRGCDFGTPNPRSVTRTGRPAVRIGPPLPSPAFCCPVRTCPQSILGRTYSDTLLADASKPSEGGDISICEYEYHYARRANIMIICDYPNLVYFDLVILIWHILSNMFYLSLYGWRMGTYTDITAVYPSIPSKGDDIL